MSLSHKYRTFDQLLEDVTVDFRTYALEGMIEPQQLIKVAMRVNYDLGLKKLPDYRLVTSGRMCAMCLGNVCWSGIKEVFSSAEPEDVESITGFDEGPTPSDYNEQLKKRVIRIVTKNLREEGKKVLKLYVDLGGQIYNATR